MKNRTVKNFYLIVLLAMANVGMLRAQTNTNAVAANAMNAAVTFPAGTHEHRPCCPDAKTAPTDAD